MADFLIMTAFFLLVVAVATNSLRRLKWQF
jgi:hypothetical protein